MKNANGFLNKFFLVILYFFIIFSIQIKGVYSQQSDYSSVADEILNEYSTDDLDVFKFSINNIVNSDGDIVEKSAGNPSIFGRTDYGSEFFLENQLNTDFSIEIPAFVINDLALDPSGDYFPVIRDGTQQLNIDFTDLYDLENGEVINPEMGFVRLSNDSAIDPEAFLNLSDGEFVEFFVKPSVEYLNSHNSESLFFIDRPIPNKLPAAEADSNEEEYETFSSSDEDQITTILVPREELITSTNGEVKVYVTNAYVPAPASQFKPSQTVMPVLADGDYNYDSEPAPAETFSDDVQVVAIPEKEAEILSKKIQEIKRKKEAPTNPKHDEDAPPALDPGIELMKKLNFILNNVQKGPSKLLSETKKNIQKEFPNISEQLVDFIIKTINSNEKFELIENPKEFLDKEFAKISDPIELNLLLDSNLTQEDLIKINNLILYKFSRDLTELGFETLENQEIDFSIEVKNADQILEHLQLQQDTMAIVSLLGSFRGNQGLSNLLIEPKEVDPNSSKALFESSKNQRVLDRIKRFSEVITLINNQSTVTNDRDQILDDTLPIVELNVGLGESIAEALEEKLADDKRLNRSFQPRTVSSQLEKFNFELQPQGSSSEPPKSISLLANSPNISAEELQIVAETTEATNNILDETIKKMLDELGDETLDKSSRQIASVFNYLDASNEENIGSTEDLIINNALSSVKRLQEIEDIRAIFQILGIGS